MSVNASKHYLLQATLFNKVMFIIEVVFFNVIRKNSGRFLIFQKFEKKILNTPA